MDDSFPTLPWFCIVVVTVSLLCVFLRHKHSNFNLQDNASLLGFLRNKHRFLDWLTDVLSTANTNTFVTPSVPFGIQGIGTANPANLEHILKTKFEKYPKGKRMKFLFHDFLGKGIFNADGDEWRVQRKSASYEFNAKSLRKFMEETVQGQINNGLMVLLSRACTSGERLDMQDVLTRFAFENICRVAFGVDPGCLHPSLPSPLLQQAFDDATDISFGRFFYLLPELTVRIKKMLNFGSERRLREAIGLVNEFAMNVVRSRRTEISENGGRPVREDLLSRFMAAALSFERGPEPHTSVEGNDRCKSDLFLKDMMVSIMLAGRDTTSSALTWFFWLLSRHPRVEEAIHSEILRFLEEREAPEKGEEINFGFEELKGMKYLHAALCESMRLYPPVPVCNRIAAEDDVLPDGTFVRKDSFVTYSIYSIGRMESIWGYDFMEFKPERWLKEGCVEVENPFRFPVFNAGPRLCIGKELGFIQMKSIVAFVLRRFVIKVEEGYRPEYSLSLTLRMEGGLPVTIMAR